MTVETHTHFYDQLRSMTDQEIFTFFKGIYTFQILTIISVATGSLALREYLVYLGAEWRTWRLLFEGRILPARLAIVLIRYGYMGAFISATIWVFGRPAPKLCEPLYRMVYGLYIVLWASAGSIFLMRLNIIFAREKKIMAIFVGMWLACIGLWIFVITQLTSWPVPIGSQYPYGPTCDTGRYPRTAAVAWGGSILFDSTVFLATLIRFRNLTKNKERGVQLRSRKWLFRSNLIYFGVSFIFNMALLLSSLLVNDPILSNLGSACAFAIHVVVATHLVFTAKGWSHGDDGVDNDEVIINTFNKNKRDRQGNAQHATSRITYTVDETVVTSIGGEEEGARRGTRRSLRCDDDDVIAVDSIKLSNDEPERQLHVVPHQHRVRRGPRQIHTSPADVQHRRSANLHYVCRRTGSINSHHSFMPKLSLSAAARAALQVSGRRSSGTESLEEPEDGPDSGHGLFCAPAPVYGMEENIQRNRASSNNTLTNSPESLSKQSHSYNQFCSLGMDRRAALSHRASSLGTMVDGHDSQPPSSDLRATLTAAPSRSDDTVPSYSTVKHADTRDDYSHRAVHVCTEIS